MWHPRGQSVHSVCLLTSVETNPESGKPFSSTVWGLTSAPCSYLFFSLSCFFSCSHTHMITFAQD